MLIWKMIQIGGSFGKDIMDKDKKITLIIFFSIMGFVGLVSILLVGFYHLTVWSKRMTVDTFTFVYSLARYKLSPIEGEPTNVNQETYEAEVLSFNPYTAMKPTSIFPTSIPYNHNSFFCFYETVNRDSKPYSDRWEIYLKCTFDLETYSFEYDRISNITGYNNKKSISSDDLFALHSITFTFNYFSEYQYAVFDEQNLEIHYISFAEIGSIDNIVFDEAFAPQKPLSQANLSIKINQNRYSIFA